MLSRRPRSRAIPRRGIWAGLALTPIIVIALAAVLGGGGGAATASSGPYSSQLKAHRTPQMHVNTQPAGLGAWSAARMAAATPMTTYPTVNPGAAGPSPHTTYQYFANYERRPVGRTVKLFFRQNGVDRFCTGSVTSGGAGGTFPSNRVWTAGNCVHDGSGIDDTVHWSSDVLACLIYDGAFAAGTTGANASVGGCWQWTSESAPCEWTGAVPGCAGFAGRALSRDYGIVYVSATAIGCSPSPLGTCASIRTRAGGGHGLAWNCGSPACQNSIGAVLTNNTIDQSWTIPAYTQQGTGGQGGACTAAAANAGQQYGGKIWVSVSEYAISRTTDTDGPDSNSVGSALCGGQAGAPWLLNWIGRASPPIGVTENSLINGNSSWVDNVAPNEEGTQTQSPYYDSVTCFDWAFWTGYTGAC